MPISKMRSGETVALAGFHFFNHPIKDVTINFRTETGELLKINLPLMGSLIPTKIDEKILDEIKNIPSILGNDFLEEQKLSLFFSPSAKVAYLEC